MGGIGGQALRDCPIVLGVVVVPRLPHDYRRVSHNQLRTAAYFLIHGGGKAGARMPIVNDSDGQDLRLSKLTSWILGLKRLSRALLGVTIEIGKYL